MILDSELLKETMALMKLAVSQGGDMPVTLAPGQDHLTVAASATHATVKRRITPVLGGLAEPVSIPGKVLAEVVSLLPGEKVELESQGNLLRIESDSYQAELTTYHEEPVSEIKQPDDDCLRCEHAKHFAEYLAYVTRPLGAANSSRYQNMLIEVGEKGALTLVATDAYWLTYSEQMLFGNSFAGTRFMLTERAATLLLQALKGASSFQLCFGEGSRMRVIVDDATELDIASGLADFPDYQRIIPSPTSYSHSLLIDGGELEAAVKRLNTVSDNSQLDLLLLPDIGRLLLRAGGEQARAEESLKAEINGSEPLPVSFNSSYLLRAIKGRKEQLTIHFTLNGAVANISTGDAFAIVAPLRVTEEHRRSTWKDILDGGMLLVA